MYMDYFTKVSETEEIYGFKAHQIAGIRSYIIHHDNHRIVVQSEDEVLETHTYDGNLEDAATFVFEELLDETPAGTVLLPIKSNE